MVDHGHLRSNMAILDSEGNSYGEIDLESEEDFCDEEGKGSKIDFAWVDLETTNAWAENLNLLDKSYHCFNVNVCFSFDKSTIKQLSGSRAINLTMIADSKLSENQKVTSRARIGGWSG